MQSIRPQGANALTKDKWEKYFNDPNYDIYNTFQEFPRRG
jgi:hypothetical protein